MTRKAGWLAGIALVVAVTAVGVGVATPGDGGTSRVPAGAGMAGAGMMGGTSMGTGMMGTTQGAGMMSAGMMSAGNMDAMHGQMMATMAGSLSPELLARCDALHGRMLSTTTRDGALGAGHASHHLSAEGTG